MSCFFDSIALLLYRYKLISVVLHTGSSTENGHYTTVARTTGSNFWRIFDDKDVSDLGELEDGDLNEKLFYSNNNIVGPAATLMSVDMPSSAFLLFYEKQ